MVSEKVENQTRRCYFCNSVENEPRIIGSYIVELKEIQYKGNVHLACQSCSRKTQIISEKEEKKSGLQRALNFFGFNR